MGYLTVEEVSARYGVPVSTVRRWCSDKTLLAEKHGRQWLVEEENLPSSSPRKRSRPRQSTAQASTFDVNLALQHVLSVDLPDVWVPDVLNFGDVPLDGALLPRVSQRLNDSIVNQPVEVPIPKTPFFTRAAVLLSVEDRVAYQAVVGSFADRVEAQTLPCVYSARLASKPGKFFFRKRGILAWLEWRKAVERDFKAGGEWIVKTDLTAYFDTISHDLLFTEVAALNVPGRTIGLLRAMLRTWAPVPGHGIPQGPNVSRLLGNLFLLPVDRAMTEAGYRYFRYLDDIYIVASTKMEATAAIRLFERECRTRGLLVSSSKTIPLRGKEALAEVSSDTDLDVTQYLIDSKQLPRARKELRRIIKSALHDDGRVDVRSARFSLGRLAGLRESSLLTSIIGRVEDLAPVAPEAMRYLRPFLTRKQVIRGLTEFLNDEERTTSPYMLSYVLALLLDYPEALPAAWISAARAFTHDRNQPVYLRSIAANVLACGIRPSDISWLRSEIGREFDPALLRAYAVALARAKSLDKNSTKLLVLRMPEIAPAIRYLQGRTSLPSLILANQANQIR